MIGLRNIAPLCAFLLLCGCIGSKNEPFSLDDGDRLETGGGDYLCIFYDENDKPTESNEIMLVSVERNNKTQYVFANRKDLRSSPVTVHRVKEGVYLGATGLFSDPGEGFFVAQFDESKLALFMYFEKTDDRINGLANKYGATVAKDTGFWVLSGALSNQRALILDLASDLTYWHKFADCKKQN
jgi:hypothetical protein